MLGQRASFELGHSVFKGIIPRLHGSKSSTYFVQFDHGRHSERYVRYVDLELPIRISAGGYSSWRLELYDECVVEA